MTYRHSQSESRARYLAGYDATEALKNDAWVNELTSADHEACVADLRAEVAFSDGMHILDAGSGTGALCLALVRVGGLCITALEPSSAMSDLLKAKPELGGVSVVNGFCDHLDDRSHFAGGTFDVIASRQLANCLYDPCAAFRNWHYWLRDEGTVAVIDGLFDRDAWTGTWDGLVDTLPLSACQTTATVAYLLEESGFRVQHAGFMTRTNALSSTGTQRYLVTAVKTNG
ncbi:MAG: methyltransferase domain-containing protein [Planctomycetota bacterium]